MSYLHGEDIQNPFVFSAIFSLHAFMLIFCNLAGQSVSSIHLIYQIMTRMSARKCTFSIVHLSWLTVHSPNSGISNNILYKFHGLKYHDCLFYLAYLAFPKSFIIAHLDFPKNLWTTTETVINIGKAMWEMSSNNKILQHGNTAFLLHGYIGWNSLLFHHLLCPMSSNLKNIMAKNQDCTYCTGHLKYALF